MRNKSSVKLALKPRSNTQAGSKKRASGLPLAGVGNEIGIMTGTGTGRGRKNLEEYQAGEETAKEEMIGIEIDRGRRRRKRRRA